MQPSHDISSGKIASRLDGFARKELTPNRVWVCVFKEPALQSNTTEKEGELRISRWTDRA